MDSADLVKLSRSGRSFLAADEETLQKIQLLRQYLNLPAEEPKEDGVFDCTDVNDVLLAVIERMDKGVIHHSRFQNDRCYGVMFGEEQFPSLGPNDSIARKSSKPVTLATASGREPDSFALLSTPLTFGIAHRCSIRITGTPGASAEPTSPGKRTVDAGSPRTQLSKLLLNNHAYTNFSCFGITRWQNQTDGDDIEKARWVGLHWHECKKPGSHISAFNAGMHRNGQPQVTPLDDVEIKIGDVLGMELHACSRDSQYIILSFLHNGKKIFERNLYNDLPVAAKLTNGLAGGGGSGSAPAVPASPGPHFLEECQFGVSLSEGVTVALLSLS